MYKSALRTTYKQKRQALSSQEKLRNDDLLLLQFQQIDFGNIQSLMTYWPMDHHGEPNTHLFSRYLRHMIPGLSVLYPKIKEDGHMEGVLIDEETIYTTNELGITEPKTGAVVLPEQIDMVLVPLLVFDLSGYRVGYGKGYYDRFLEKCREDCLLVGLSYFEPIENISDTHEFDIPLTLGITPTSVYEF